LTDISQNFRTVILAGERPGGSPISQAFDVPASVMVPVAGKPAIARVIEAVENSRMAAGGIICGPSAEIVANSQQLQTILGHPQYEWLDQSTGPAASAMAALEKLDQFPALLTAGDHALLTGTIVDDFCTQVLLLQSSCGTESGFDLVVGFVPFELVQKTWPESKRTVLKFYNGQFCGSNLFAILSPKGKKALDFWRQAETDRKKPWKIARRFGFMSLLRYLFRRLSLEDALQGLSNAAGCRIGHVKLAFARAAVDVDSIEDQHLAEKILSKDK
jgi:GTP:adenosylcobinamide-phosphate guanylyltransferase